MIALHSQCARNRMKMKVFQIELIVYYLLFFERDDFFIGKSFSSARDAEREIFETWKFGHFSTQSSGFEFMCATLGMNMNG